MYNRLLEICFLFKETILKTVNQMVVEPSPIKYNKMLLVDERTCTVGMTDTVLLPFGTFPCPSLETRVLVEVFDHHI
jgi:hypothetical protein